MGCRIGQNPRNPRLSSACHHQRGLRERTRSLGRQSHAQGGDRACRIDCELHLARVNADLENGFGNDPEAAGLTISQALDSEIAGCSIEDFGDGSIYERELAVERIRAAVEANQGSDSPLVLTARAENYFRGNPDLKDAIERLQAYQEAGADVLYAPGLTKIDEIQSLIAAVDRPVNILVMPGGPTIPELFEVGAIRISTGSAISMAAQSAIVNAARELVETGTHEFWLQALPNMGVVKEALSGDS